MHVDFNGMHNLSISCTNTCISYLNKCIFNLTVAVTFLAQLSHNWRIGGSVVKGLTLE